MRMKKRVAALCAVTVGGLVSLKARGLDSEETADGVRIRRLESYPAIVRFSVTVSNGGGAAETALSVRDPILEALGWTMHPAPPFSLGDRAAFQDGFDVTLGSEQECLAMAASDGHEDRSIDAMFSIRTGYGG